MRLPALYSLVLLSGLALLLVGARTVRLNAHLPTVQFQAMAPTASSSAAPAVSTQTTAPAIMLPPESPWTPADRQAFIGSYQTTGQCTPSATCCCALGSVTITPGQQPSQLQLAGPADGGPGCLGQSSLAGAFNMNAPMSAYTYLDFVPVLIQLQSDPSHQWLQLNSSRTTCNNVFQRIPDAQAVANSVAGAITDPSAANINNVINTGAAQLPSALPSTLPSTSTLPSSTSLPSATSLPSTSALPSSTSLPSGTAATGSSGFMLPTPNADGSLTLPSTTLGQGASAVTLPQATLPSLNQQSAGQLPIGQQQSQTMPTGSAGFPQLQNPFASTQATGASIPPTSTSIPFNTQLPQVTGAAPFDINALQAVPLPTTGAASSSAPIASASANPTGLPTLPSTFPQVGSSAALPQIGSASNPSLPQVGSNPSLPQVGAAGGNPLSNFPTVGQTPVLSNNPLGSAPVLPGQQVSTQSTSPSTGSAQSASTNPFPPFGSTGALPNTPFNSASSSSTAAPASQTIGAVTFTPLLVELPNSGAEAGSKNYMAAFIVPQSTNLAAVILHYFSGEDMRQKNVYMNKTTSSALASQLLSSVPAGSAITSGSAYDLYTFAPIPVADDDVLTYSYTFAPLPNGIGAVNTQAYSFPSTAQPAVQSIAMPEDAAQQFGITMSPDSNSTTIGGGSGDIAAIDTNSVWNGVFAVDESCVPSDTCCCGVGTVNVSSTFANPNQVLLTGLLDGGAGCLYQTSLTGLMSINSSNPRQASRSIQIPNEAQTVVTFYAALDQPAEAANSTEASPERLRVWNTFRSCETVANKVSSYAPADVNEESELPDGTLLFPNDTSEARDAFVGEYEFDNSCKPSSSCCCAVGDLSISPVLDSTPIPQLPAAIASLAGSQNASAPQDRNNLIILSTDLDGGSACVGMKSVSQAFHLVNSTAASFSFPPVSLNAALVPSRADSAQLDSVIFTNNMYPGCMSRAMRKPANQTTDQQSNTTIADPAQMQRLRDSLVGEYEPSGCTPSADCCCATGRTQVTANSSSPLLLNVHTSLAGEGFSCLQRDGDVSMTFTLVNSTNAVASPFAGVNVRFSARVDPTFAMTSSSSSPDRFIITNSVHPNCPVTMTRVQGNRDSAAPARSATLPWMLALLLVAVASLMRR